MVLRTTTSSYYNKIILLAISWLVNTCHSSDHDSLSSFHRSISATASSPLNWSASDPCTWEGVGCDNYGRVHTLWLPSRGLSGGIPPSLCNLSHLARLNLSHNQISGPLPEGLFSYFHWLRVFDLSSNQITGTLTMLDKLPATVKTFNLSGNCLEGTIPSLFFQTAKTLESFDISNNGFFGPIPSGLGSCSNLQSLRAGFNKLSGEIIDDIYQLLNLQELYLTRNQLSGQINARISNLVNLRTLALQENNLTGTIPRGIGRLSKLDTLLLHDNQLSGAIPESLANCTALVTMILRANFLKGEISGFDFSKFINLTVIDLAHNSFTGGLPGSLFSCKMLTAIRLGNNHLDGEIPLEITALNSLSFLSISGSNLTNIRKTLMILTGCKNLRTLLLEKNFYDEEIPDGNEIENLIASGGFQNLQMLGMMESRLTGSIPQWLSKLTNLAVLNLGQNSITGSIPPWLGTLPNLFFLRLAYNRLSGHFPVELTRLQGLASHPKFKQGETNHFELPLLYGNTTKMHYTGLDRIPGLLSLVNNSISGSIPDEIGNLKFVSILVLSHNSFSGSIPATLSKLTNLERLDLSVNNLSGEIPESLKNLHFLSLFDVSDNNLQGPVPTGGQFDTFPSSSFEGNPELCGQIMQRPCQARLYNQEPIEDLRSSEGIINWLSFEISYSISFILTVFIVLKFSRSELL